MAVVLLMFSSYYSSKPLCCCGFIFSIVLSGGKPHVRFPEQRMQIRFRAARLGPVAMRPPTAAHPFLVPGKMTLLGTECP